jgi:hypothetical protein
MKGVRSDGKEGPSFLLDNFDVGESEKNEGKTEKKSLTNKKRFKEEDKYTKKLTKKIKCR